MIKLKTLILTSPRSKCGIADYVDNLFNQKNLASQSSFEFVILPLGFKNLLKAPFQGFKIIHIQHEFFLFDRFVGISGIFWFFYLKFSSYFCKFKIVTTVHSPYNPKTVFRDFKHTTTNQFLLIFLKFYLQIYFWVLFNFSTKIILLTNNSYFYPPLQASKKSVIISLQTKNQKFPACEGGLGGILPKFLTKKNSKIFTLFGFAFKNKNYQTAILALAEVLKTHSNVFLVIVSEENNHLQELQKLASSLKIEENVIFTGYLDFDSPYLQAIFQKTNAFIFPFLERNQASSSFFTVLSLAKPIITSDIRIFKEYDFLLKFPETDLQALKRQMKLVLNQGFDKNILEKMKEYSEENSPEKVFEKHLEIYSDLVKNLD